MTDEALSSLQNFVVLFAALRFLDVGDLGRFTLAYTGALLMESALKSLVLEPLAIRFSAADEQTRRQQGAACLGAAIVLSLAAGLVVCAIGLALPGDGRSVTVVTGVVIPLLVIQEGWRVYFFSSKRPWSAAVNDGLCLTGTLALVAVAATSAAPSVELLLALWGIGTAIGAVAGAGQARLLPRPGATRAWTRSNGRLGAGLAGGGSIEQLSGRVALGLIGTIAGNAALGTFAAARTVLSPATTMVASTLSFAVPEAVRVRACGHRHLARLVAGLSVALGAVVAVVAVAIALAPDSVGEVVAGPNWGTAQVLLLPVAIAGSALAARQGPRVGLRVLERSGAVLRLSTVTGVIVVVATAGGAAASGANGAAWGFAGAHVAATGTWWLVYGRLARHDLQAPPATGAATRLSDYPSPT